ncbi:Asp-tRNA(Asn)/Glu-tRNA(Gln) amidotransferase subunit GatC [Neptuniibacter sp. CAU 1671]|uniref:Asp-tRNA(Asn)/Glu-tRNA(Gln) amidotransferase subunit GatC n=1 Tax=Neptuniibacter sp. CAU 1671 TaxID=3032593 RepID=UPI0023DCDFF2|nr:Asp-tRNA(Asn)/Glu-tRNA(Gln) amidotransferase subunit GatC [Neptuniibacter sp. CAU 1671]MDF2182224.1 Asp-tRNA(Asn)/Glu-tRNA(Gln) amidotransferase subunit GatC [Neptuniibacter sp. CAU 1671]
MSLDRSDVEKIAHLARLQIAEQDIPQYTENLTNILQLVDQLQAVNTTGVEPMAHPLDAVQRLRADDVTELDQRTQLQAHAPAVEEGLFLVPRVIE